jgi:hypothetical protein
LRDETRDLREELDVLHKTNTEKATNLTHAANKGTIVNSNRMKSILSEAAASGATPTHDTTSRQGKLVIVYRA